MKRGDVLRHLASQGCELWREGTNHTLYWNPATNRVSAIPRHNEIPDNIVRSICKQLDITAPPR